MSDDKIDMMLSLIEWDYLTDAEHKTIESFEKQYREKGELSPKQIKWFKDIFDCAAGRVEWSR